MSWFVELLQRNGTVLQRIAVPLRSQRKTLIQAPNEIIITTNDGEAKTIHTEPSIVFTIGRALDNDLVLDDVHCAPYHATLEISDDNSATLISQNTFNGVRNQRNKKLPIHNIENDQQYTLGNTLIRIRNSNWALADEIPLFQRAIWPFAVLMLTLALARGAWEIWTKESLLSITPPYLYTLSSMAIALCIWSGFYALIGRLITGSERFFTHLLIASTGYLTGSLLIEFLETISFSFSWLWPLIITPTAVVCVTAATVRAHLRTSDPRHWPVLRFVVALVASGAIIIPIAQEWISSKRLTDVQMIRDMKHPAFLLAKPTTPETFIDTSKELKEKLDKKRKNNEGEEPVNSDE